MDASPAPAPAPPRRDAILAAATELFAQQGFHGVGMRAIADAVGIRSSSLYHHFPSKLDLLRAISVDYTRDFVAQQLPALEAGGDPADGLRTVLRDHIVYFHHHRLQAAVGTTHLRELSQLQPESYAEIQEIRRRYQQAIQAVIQRGIDAGRFDVTDARIAGLEVLGLVNSVREWFRDDGERTLEQIADEYAAVAVDRILGAKPA